MIFPIPDHISLRTEMQGKQFLARLFIACRKTFRRHLFSLWREGCLASIHEFRKLVHKKTSIDFHKYDPMVLAKLSVICFGSNVVSNLMKFFSAKVSLSDHHQSRG